MANNDMRDVIANIGRDIERWKAELTKAEMMSGGVAASVVETLRRWIAEGEKIVRNTGY